MAVSSPSVLSRRPIFAAFIVGVTLASFWLVTPSGYSYTYDSSGSGDGQMPGTNVPEGGFGFAWAGLVMQVDTTGTGGTGGTAATNGTGSSGSGLANTGSGVQALLLIGGAVTLTALGVAGVTVVGRCRRNA